MNVGIVHVGVFKPGELIKRKASNEPRARSLSMILGEDNDNYTLYNLTVKDTKTVAKCVVESLYNKIQEVD